MQFGMKYGFSAAKSQGEVDDILAASRDLGITFVDTARVYGDSEEKIGSYLRRHSFPDLTVATKLAPVPQTIVADARALRDHILASLNGSRSALGMDRLDIVMLHQADEWVTGSEAFWDIVAEFGRARSHWGEFGVSLYDVTAAQQVLSAAPSIVRVVEIPYNIFDRRFAALADDFRRLGTRVISRSAFLKGLLPLPVARLPEWADDLAPAKRRLEELAATGGTSVAELALRFCLRAGFIESTIVGVDSPRELRASAGWLGPRPELDDILDEITLMTIDPELVDPRRWLAFGF